MNNEVYHVVIFQSEEEGFWVLLDIHVNIFVEHMFHNGQSIAVLQEDALLLKLFAGDKIKAIIPLEEFVKNMVQDK